MVLSAGSAVAAPPPQFVGLQAWQDLSESEFDRLGNAKVQVFRAQLNWASVEPEQPTDCTDTACTEHSYRWGRYDEMFARAAANGVRIVPVLLGSPSWASEDRRWAPVRGRPGNTTWKRQAFYDFAEAAAKRYGPAGTFWADKGYDESVRARYWQVWNEPNLPNYWWDERDGRRAASEYAFLLRVTNAALKSGDPSALTLSAGLPWSSGATLDPPSFLKVMFSKSGTSSATNFVAIHPYARTPSYVLEGVRLTRRALNETSASSRPIWLTEFGWAQSGPASTYTVSADAQAKYLRDTYRALLRYRTSYGIQGAFWFNLINVKRSPDKWYYHTGLYKSDRRSPYESWWALNCVTSGGDFCWAGR